MRKLVTFILLGGFVLAGLGAPAAEAKNRCKARTDLPGVWYVSFVLFDNDAPFANCKAVYSKRGGINIDKSNCIDSFGSRYFARSGGVVSLNRACQVSGQVVLSAFGEGGQANAHPLLERFQPGAEVSVIVELDNLRMVRDKLSMHGSGTVTYAGPSFSSGTPRADTFGAILDVIKK